MGRVSQSESRQRLQNSAEFSVYELASEITNRSSEVRVDGKREARREERDSFEDRCEFTLCVPFSHLLTTSMSSEFETLTNLWDCRSISEMFAESSKFGELEVEVNLEQKRVSFKSASMSI